jgi:hypothetical protein
MKFEEHCAESERIFGKPYEKVHRWLDEFAGKPPYGMKHRRVRHHLAGIKEAELLFGKKATRAAKRHIVSDLKMEGWTENDPFPCNEKDYVRMGLY